MQRVNTYKYLDKGVELKIVFEDTTLILTEALVISDFTGPGILTIESLTPTPQDTSTLRSVNITNSNIPSTLDYADPLDYDNQLNWDAYLDNSCMLISGNTCSQVSIRGFSFSAKVFPVVMTANTATMDIRFNFFNQINAFTLSEYDVAAGLKINGGMVYTFQNKYTTDTDTNGLLLHGCQVHLSEPAGAGGHLVIGGSGVAVSYDAGAFTHSIELYEIDGFWAEDQQTIAFPQATESLLGGGKIATNAIALAAVNDTDIMTALKTKALIDQEFSAMAIFEDQKADGTDGGTFTSGAWQTRVLNTTSHNTITGASLSANQITLPAGTYHISIVAAAVDVGVHGCKFRNVSDNTDALIGVNAASDYN